MASRKKRNKKYHGKDAVQTPPVIKISAPERSRPMQWLHENKQKLLIRAIQITVVAILGLIIYWIFG